MGTRGSERIRTTELNYNIAAKKLAFNIVRMGFFNEMIEVTNYGFLIVKKHNRE